MRDRVIAGLLAANAVYSSANAIPLNLLHNNHADCGALALPFAAIRFGRGWWFGGKYALVSFEVTILAASAWALTGGGRAITPRVETTMHLASWAVGMAAFAAFFVRCADIEATGYNTATQSEAETTNDDGSRLGPADDLDDFGIEAQAGAIKRFERGRAAYDALVQQMLQVWTGALGVAILQWLHLRWRHARAMQRWHRMAAATAAGEAADEWADTRRSGWRAERRALDAQREGYAEVARPLAPYVVVFFLFGV